MAAREAITTTKLKKFLSGPAPEKDQYLRAPDGFGVRRFKESGKASFIVEAKVRGQGKARRVTIGPAEPELLGEAKDKARVIVARLRSGEDVTATEKAKQSEAVSQRVTIKTALDCMLEQRQGELKPETLRFYKSTITNHAGPLLNKRVTDIGLGHIRDHLRRTERSKSQSTASKLRLALSAVIGYAITEYALPITNPIKEIKGVAKAVAGRQSYVPDHRIGNLVSEINDLRKTNKTHGNYLHFVLATGCRKSEGMKLKWDDVDWDRLCVTFRETKNGRDHTLPITCWLDVLLREQLAIRKGNNPWVFPGRVHGTRLTDVRKSLERYISKDVVWTPKQDPNYFLQVHDLRRTAATHMEGVGIPKARVSIILNHKGSSITDRYIQQNFDSLMGSLESYHRWLLRSTDHIAQDDRRVRELLLTPTLATRLKQMGMTPQDSLVANSHVDQKNENVIVPDYWKQRGAIERKHREGNRQGTSAGNSPAEAALAGTSDS